MSKHAAPGDTGRSHERHAHGEEHGQALRRLLDLEAVVMAGYLEQATRWAASLGAARHVVELGPGVGAATVALAQALPQATVLALDSSPEMLARVRERAVAAGVDDRVRTAQVDLNDGLDGPDGPDGLEGIDLVWASSVLHELDAPGEVLAALGERLSPSGHLVTVEMDAPPTFLPDLGLERRIHGLFQTLPSGLPAHPDWTDDLEGAGLSLAERRTFVIDQVPEQPRAAGELAFANLVRVRAHLADRIAADDLVALDDLLGEGPSSLRARTDLHVRGSRTALAARRP